MAGGIQKRDRHVTVGPRSFLLDVGNKHLYVGVYVVVKKKSKTETMS